MAIQGQVVVPWPFKGRWSCHGHSRAGGRAMVIQGQVVVPWPFKGRWSCHGHSRADGRAMAIQGQVVVPWQAGEGSTSKFVRQSKPRQLGKHGATTAPHHHHHHHRHSSVAQSVSCSRYAAPSPPPPPSSPPPTHLEFRDDDLAHHGCVVHHTQSRAKDCMPPLVGGHLLDKACSSGSSSSGISSLSALPTHSCSRSPAWNKHVLNPRPT